MAASNGKKVESNDKVVVTPERKKPRTSRIRWTFGLLTRLTIWYFLLTPFFRCPSNVADLTDSSPRICKPYLVAKSYVEPHVTPYYNAHAAPYIDAARPYVRIVNEKIYTPASNIAKQGYETYGAPALEKAQAYGQEQWDANVVPHIQTAKGKANDWYVVQVKPHVDTASATVSPYYTKVNGAYWTVVDGYVMPFAATYQPFIGKTYTSGQEILTTNVLPHAQNAWFSTVYFVNNSLWPRVSSLYSENVEPQLVKIGQRLASYREGSTLRSVAHEAESSVGYTTSSFTSTETAATTSPTTAAPVVTPTASLSPAEVAAQLREKITSDLVTWKERFASASEKGVAGLEGRVVEIVDTYLANGAQTHGDKLAAELQSVVEEQTNAIKSHISTLTESLPFEDAPEQEEAVVEQLQKELRNSAMAIRDRAHVLREWHVSFEQDLIQKVAIAVNSTLAVLDNVRDLGLQEIGMRWAWMDGVTYKDWEDYHALKEEFEDWKGKFREIGLQHARIEAVKDAADETLSRGMDVAESAAKELARLKEVGRWKIAAREVSEDFDTRSGSPPPLPKPTVAAGEEVPVVSDEDQEVLAETKEDSDINDTVVAAEPENETGAESPELDELEEPVEADSDQEAEALGDALSGFPAFEADSKDDNTHAEAEAPKAKDETEPKPGNLFGAAAASVLLEKAAADIDDADKLDQDDIIIDAQATKVSEALSESLGIENINEEPTPSQAPNQDKAIEDLLSHILGDADSAFAEKVLKRLNTIYETPKPGADTPASEAPAPEVSTEQQADGDL
ncbi:hypothetical protein BDV19DRAFT_393394 [Aspergillus venezuelensis]